MNWYCLYFIALFLINTFYYKEYLVIINNTKAQLSSIKQSQLQKHTSYLSKIGLSTALGMSCCVFIVSLLAFFLCFLLKTNATILMYFQILCLGYILYIGIKQMTTKNNILDNSHFTTSKNIVDAFYDGFVNTLSKYELLFLIIATTAQYYENIDNILDILFMMFALATLQFISSFVIILCCNNINIIKCITKNANFISRVAGFALILMSSMNVKQILKF